MLAFHRVTNVIALTTLTPTYPWTQVFIITYTEKNKDEEMFTCFIYVHI